MSVAEAVYEGTCHICDAVKSSFLKIFYNIQRGRQLSANQRIFQEMMHIDRDAGYHLANMNERTNQEYDQKISELKTGFKWGWDDNGED